MAKDEHDDFQPSGFDVLEVSLESKFENLHARVGKIESRFDSLEVRFEKVEAGLDVNNEATKRIETNTADLIELYGDVKGGFKVLEGIGKFAKPVAYIIGLITSLIALYTAYKAGGVSPK